MARNPKELLLVNLKLIPSNLYFFYRVLTKAILGLDSISIALDPCYVVDMYVLLERIYVIEIKGLLILGPLFTKKKIGSRTKVKLVIEI